MEKDKSKYTDCKIKLTVENKKYERNTKDRCRDCGKRFSDTVIKVKRYIRCKECEKIRYKSVGLKKKKNLRLLEIGTIAIAKIKINGCIEILSPL